VEAAQCGCDLLHAFGQLIRVDRAAGDEERHKAIVQRRRDRRSDAQSRGGLSRQALGLAVDAEQVRVLARTADNVLSIAERHAEVAIGDAALELARIAGERSQRGFEAPEDVVKLAHHPPGTLVAP
jgi:hypothetical protein